MPAPPRPTGPILPVDLLWRHELKEHNATILRRITALEDKFKEQERRVQVAEEAAATCTGMTKELDLVKNGIDQLELKQQEFMSGVHKRLVDMDKDMGEFRKTQERVQKLMSAYREMDDSVSELTLLGPRVDDAEREIHGLKNSVSRKHVDEMENLDTRLEALELQRSREDIRIRTMQEDFTKKCNGEFQALRAEVVKLMEAKRAAQPQQPYLQVPRSPEARPSASVQFVPYQPDRRSVPKKGPGRPRKEPQMVHQQVETQGTTQTSAQDEDVEELDLDTNIVPNITSAKRQVPPADSSPRKKPKLSHPKSQPKAQAKVQTQSKTEAQTKIQSQAKPQKKQREAQLSASRPAPSKVVKLPITANKKKPGPPISAPRPTKDRPVAPQKQVSRGPTSPPQLRERQSQQPPARKSPRRSGNATIYELGHDNTQQPQKTAGPVYDIPAKPLKTKPRRLPPVPDE